LEAARGLEARGRVDLAAGKWKQLLLVDPNNTEALGGLARASRQTGHSEDATHYLERLRAINPNDPGIQRIEQMGTAQDQNVQLQQAGKLAQQGQYAQAMKIYRQVYGSTPPPGDAALAYYETESATEEGRPHAVEGLRGLVARFPGDTRYQISLGRILTYNPRTRQEGRRLLEAHPNDSQAVEALRQSLLWDAQNPATAGDIREYLKRHPDSTLETVLQHKPRSVRLTPMTEAERAAAAVNATRNAEDRKAYALLNRKRLEQAEEEFKSILGHTPDDPNALAGMGYIRMQQGNFGGAVSFLVQARQDGSRDPNLETALATSRFWFTMDEAAIALDEGDLSAAEKEYRAALQMRPASVEALEGLGGALLKAQQPEAAIPVFAQFAKLNPSAAHAWRGLFLAEYGAGNAAQALATERQIPDAVRPELAKDPLYLSAFASALRSAGRDSDAQKVLATALNLPFSPDDQSVQADAKLQYAALLLQANRFEQAGALYRQVLAKDPNNVAAFQGLVRVQHTAGQDDQALSTIESMSPEIYSKAMRDGGFDVTVASLYASQHRLDVAQDILEKTLQVETADGAKPAVDVQIQLAGIYLQRGNTERAFSLYREILSQYPDRVGAWKGLIDSFHATGQDREALAQIQQIPPAIRLKLESDVDYLQTVGAIYNTLGQPQEAQVFLRRVEAHYASQHIAPPAEVEVQNAWLLYNSGSDAALWRQLMALGARTDLTTPQRRTVQTIWTNFSVRRANAAAAAGHDRQAIDILNANARAFPGNPDVVKALAGGYARAGMAKQAVAIWKSMDLKSADVADYRSAIGSALAANDQKDAETWLRFALNQYPKDAQVLLLGAKFEQQRGDVNRARDYYLASLKAMPQDGPGVALATELSRPAPATIDLPGSTQSAQDLSILLAPSQPVAPSQPYLPGSPDTDMAPLQLAQPEGYLAPQSNPPSYTNPVPSPNAQPARLKDFVPQASLAPRANGTNVELPPEDHPSLSPAGFQHRQIVRLTQRLERSHVVLTQQPTDRQPLYATVVLPSELSQGATFRAAAFIGSPLQAQQQGQQPLTPQPTAQKPATTPATTDGIVYGPYVPYVPPSKRQPVAPQVAQPMPPLTKKPTGQPLSSGNGANGTTVVNGVVYGPYVPYVPPAPPTRQIPKPEVTDVLPTAKVSPGVAKVPPTTHTGATSAEAAAAARRRAHAAPSTGYSKPPVEDYATPTSEPAPPVQAPPAQTPPQVQFAPVYVKPSAQLTPVQSSSSARPNYGDSEGQQYPQPRAVVRSRASRQRSSIASASAPGPVNVAPGPAPSSAPGPALSYPGVGSPLGYQPYPVIGPAYPLPAAPTDRDLIEKQVPPLRGGYYTGELLAPNVPLTERQQAERDLAALEGSYSGWMGGTGSARYRSGVVGYDRLTDLETTFEASYVAANKVRFSVVPKAVFLNSGQLNVGSFNGVTGSPVLGTYDTSVAVNNPTEQFANGIGGEFQVTARNFAVAVGYTPYEFLVENYTGRVLWRPDSHFTLYANRDTVDETQLSYAGMRDPGSATNVYPGNIWGGVVSTGGGVRFDRGDEKAGFYITADGADLTGYHVLQNTKFEGSMGAYFLAHTFPGYGRLNVGVSLFGMHYAQNERALSYGLGGYFSPDAYLLASVPITFVGRYRNNFHYTIAGSVGVQTFQEDSQLYFPLDRALETSFATSSACSTSTIANHTCAQYPTNSNTGGNYSLNSEGAYRIADHWYAGGFLFANNTNNYNTVTGGFFVRYLFRPQIGTDDYPTGLFPVEGFRPLRVP
jgi:tetratricopeptide (TPR) repeat protein